MDSSPNSLTPNDEQGPDCLISNVVVNWNTRNLLKDCIDSILTTAGSLNPEIIIVDNASTDGSQDFIRASYPNISLLENQENVGFARGNNQGVNASHGRFILLLNSDAFLLPGALQKALEQVQTNPKVGIVGAQLLNPDGSFQASHTRFPTNWQEFLILSGLGRMLCRKSYPSYGPEESKGPQIVDYVEGAFLLVRRDAYTQIGGLDESYFMYSEEVDLCYRMKNAGWEVWYHPEVEVVHIGGASSKQRKPQREADLYRSRVHFMRKSRGDFAANLLKIQIFFFTGLKIMLHILVRLATRQRHGRQVISLTELEKILRNV
jgi:hypothetical protein